MEIVYSSSNVYAEICGISIISLFETNKHVEIINVYIIDNGIDDVNREKFKEIADKYNRKIELISCNLELLIGSINLQRWNISTFGRLFEASIFPNLDKVIHIDCDTIITGSLESVWNLNLDNYILAGAMDCISDCYKKNIGLNSDDIYINAGFLVLNLKKIREKNYEKIFLDYIKNNGSFLTFVDQEVINACIVNCEKKVLPLNFNSYSIIHFFNHKNVKKIRRYNHFYSNDEYEDAKNNPIVIHFTTCFMEGTRPWIENDRHPLKEKFFYYKKMSPWKDNKLWKDNRSFLKKATDFILKIISKTFLKFIVGYIHGVYLPKKNLKLKKEKRYINGKTDKNIA